MPSCFQGLAVSPFLLVECAMDVFGVVTPDFPYDTEQSSIVQTSFFFFSLTPYHLPTNTMKLAKSKLVVGLLSALLCTGAFAQKKVALVTFYCDKKIGGTGLGSAAESLINDPSFNLKPLMNKSYDRYVKDFAKDFPFQLIDNTEITGNDAYKNYQSRWMVDTTKGFNKITGQQFVTANELIFAYGDITLAKEENRDQCNLNKIFETADGILFVSMDYEFESRMMGLGAGITAYLNMFLYDKQCGKVFRIREYGKSKGKVAAVAGIPVMDPKKIQPLCEDATDVLFAELEGKLSKIVKKSAKF
jgi:hypothetical protein